MFDNQKNYGQKGKKGECLSCPDTLKPPIHLHSGFSYKKVPTSSQGVVIVNDDMAICRKLFLEMLGYF